ncbi:MAG: NAD(+) synthase [Bacteroidales bacterium]|nr:NAD(+) synthase [Bacteroidales bacterium]
MKHGFIKVAAAIPAVKVADCSFNREAIDRLLKRAYDDQVEIICFPELSLTAYTCGDLFHQQLLVEEAEAALDRLLTDNLLMETIGIVGMPVRLNNQLFNAAVAFQYGRVLGVVPKTFLPNYNEFYEKRWFSSALDTDATEIKLCGKIVPFGTNILFKFNETTFAIELCEDLWVTSPPSSRHSIAGAQIVFNLSASDENIGKHDYLKSLIKQQSARCIGGYVYASSGFGESTTDLVFAGNALIAENGSFLATSERFSFEEQLIISEIDIERLASDRRKNSAFMLGNYPLSKSEKYHTIHCDAHHPFEFSLTRDVTPFPFIPSGIELHERCGEIFNIQVSGLATRITHTQSKKVIIGISGGLDSTLALLVCVKTFDKLGIPRENILGITMPGFGTTGRTYRNALTMIHSLGVTLKEVDIKPACEQHFKDINHSADIHDVTYENTQARERTQILMNIANQQNGMVLGTGDLSELALGWATYNGDHMSMYGVNAGVPKTLVRYLVKYVADSHIDEAAKETLLDVLATPVSPELLPMDEKGEIAQKTEDVVGPYELHDFFLYYTVRFGFRPTKIYFLAQHAFKGKYDNKTLLNWLKTFFRRFFSQQFKRSCLPDGPKVGSINLSPRGDWRMPSDATSRMWLDEIEGLKE